MTYWFFILGLPLAMFGVGMVFFSSFAGRCLTAFPRNVIIGRILCAIGWFFTAYELDTLGIEVFDRFLKVFPGELWILAGVLTFLTCIWMDNLLPIRGLSAIFMLFPAELFPVIRLEPTAWRLTLTAFAYFCAMWGMFAMFYPWRIRQLLAWASSRPIVLKLTGAIALGYGGLLIALGIML